MNMNQTKQTSGPQIIEKGYRPVGTLNTQKPPQGGSAVPSKPTVVTSKKSTR